jgi:ABC-type uncharacterized transport system auxiliary subunit
MIRSRMIWAAALAALTAGCSVLPDPPPAAKIYPLRAMATVASPQIVSTRTMSVAAPAMAQALAGTEIVWIKDGVIGYMERGAWPSRTPDALQGLMVETIDRNGHVAAVLRAGEGARVDAELRWSVEDFQIVEDGSGLTARFAADINLMESRSRTIIASTRIDVVEPVLERSAPQAAAALARAGQKGASQISLWAAQSLDAVRPNTPTPPAQSAPTASSVQSQQSRGN